MQKVRRHKIKDLAPTACKRMVSGTLSLPLRGTFHLSLTVLVHYRSPLVFSLAGWSPRIRSGFHVSGPTQAPTEGVARVSSTGLLPSTVGLSCAVRLPARFVTPRPPCGATHVGPATPPTQRPQASTWNTVWAAPLSLATTQGIETFFPFLRVLRCIISPGSLLAPYVFRCG
jgi:hypothetical protein